MTAWIGLRRTDHQGCQSLEAQLIITQETVSPFRTEWRPVNLPHCDAKCTALEHVVAGQPVYKLMLASISMQFALLALGPQVCDGLGLIDPDLVMPDYRWWRSIGPCDVQ